MNRRTFITTGTVGLAATCTPFFTACTKRVNDEPHDRWQCSYNSTPMETVIAVSGLEKPVTIMHISDSHISCDAEADREFEPYSTRMNQAFLSVKHYKTLEPTTPLRCFEELMQTARTETVDLLALTGDIVNYPSATAVEAVRKQLAESGRRHFYVAGNHDWHYEGMPGSDDEQRQEWCRTRLAPLYTTDNPLCFSIKLGGVNLIGIDNSTYQINDEQLAFYIEQQRQPEPILLFAHIPFYMPTLRISCGHPEWGFSTDRNYEIERRERWPATGASAATKEFIRQLEQTEKLIGIFTGHWHSDRTVTHRQENQFLAGAAFNGRYRMIRLIPATDTLPV